MNDSLLTASASQASSQEPSPYRHILSSQQFSPDFMEEITSIADFMRKNEHNVSNELRGKIVSLVFYEASTRTRLSFEAAALRLGGSKIHTESAAEFSSVSKGETLEDTVRIVSAYSDFLVLRHGDDDSSQRAAAVSPIPVINAGSGKLHHPTQALLDVFTIKKECRRTDGLSICLVGDLLRGRTCDSLVYLLAKYPGNHFIFVAPENCRVKESLKSYLAERGNSYEETEDMESALPKADVVYMTRIQKERFATTEEYMRNKGLFILDKRNINLVRKDAVVMHPLPRVDEISSEIDDDPRCKYFEQAANGLYVRMALFSLLNKHLNK